MLSMHRIRLGYLDRTRFDGILAIKDGSLAPGAPVVLVSQTVPEDTPSSYQWVAEYLGV